MTNSRKAFESIKRQYDLDTLREIVEYGCALGIAHNHVYYRETCAFFDEHEEELIDYVVDTFGEEINSHYWNININHLNGYKNDIVWTFIESIAQEIIDEAETDLIEFNAESLTNDEKITLEELSHA